MQRWFLGARHVSFGAVILAVLTSGVSAQAAEIPVKQLTVQTRAAESTGNGSKLSKSRLKRAVFVDSQKGPPLRLVKDYRGYRYPFGYHYYNYRPHVYPFAIGPYTYGYGGFQTFGYGPYSYGYGPGGLYYSPYRYPYGGLGVTPRLMPVPVPIVPPGDLPEGDEADDDVAPSGPVLTVPELAVPGPQTDDDPPTDVPVPGFVPPVAGPGPNPYLNPYFNPGYFGGLYGLQPPPIPSIYAIPYSTQPVPPRNYGSYLRPIFGTSGGVGYSQFP